MKYFLTSLFLLFLSLSSGHGQKLSVSTNPNKAGDGIVYSFANQEFTIKPSNRSISVGDSTFRVDAWALSPNNAYLALALRDGNLFRVRLFQSTPFRQLGQVEHEVFDPQDPSLSVSVNNGGQIVVRSNISLFSIYNYDGNFVSDIKNNTNSADGELISELVFSPSGLLSLLINPEIRYGSKKGSRAKLVVWDGTEANEFFFSNTQVILDSFFSPDDRFFALILSNGKEGQVKVFDWLGNAINVVALKTIMHGGQFSADGSRILVYSMEENRVQVYDTFSDKRFASASFRGEKLSTAVYDRNRDVVIGLSSKSSQTGLISGATLFLLDVAARKLSSAPLGADLTFDPLRGLKTHSSGKTITVQGASKEIVVTW